MKRLTHLALAIAWTATVTPASAQGWQRTMDKGIRIAGVAAEDDTFLGFFCAPNDERKLAFLTLKPGILHSPIQFDQKAMDVRFIIDDERFDFPGKADDGELYIEIADYNLALRLDQVIAALGAAKRASVAIPIKNWSIDIPVAGAADALDGIMAPCR
jgi:hypothetical protein